VTAGNVTTVDFSCSTTPTFVVTITGTYRHFTGFSRVCFAVVTTPPQPNVAFNAQVTGPPGGVQGSGFSTNQTDTNGMKTVPNDINLFGTYFMSVNFGGGVTGTGSVNVTGAAGTGTC
jgi:hypothetical protein